MAGVKGQRLSLPIAPLPLRRETDSTWNSTRSRTSESNRETPEACGEREPGEVGRQQWILSCGAGQRLASGGVIYLTGPPRLARGRQWHV